MMHRQQLEFGINTGMELAARGLGAHRITRSDWWFLQMRLAVERATTATTKMGPNQIRRPLPWTHLGLPEDSAPKR